MSRNVLIGGGAFVVIVALIAIAGIYSSSGQNSDEEKQDKGEKVFATDPFELQSGLAIVKMTHQGEGTFVVNLLSARQEATADSSEPIEFSGDQNGGSDTEVASALADEKGSVRTSKAVNIPVAGKHIFDVKADGPWTIEVEQPRPSSAPKTTSFSGKDSTATPFFWLSSGWKEITVTNPLKTNLVLSLHDKDGNQVGLPPVDETDKSEQSPSESASTTVNIHEDGIYLFNVQSDGLWTIDVADAEQPADTQQPNSLEQDLSTLISSNTFLIVLINLSWVLILAVAIRLSRT